METNWCIFTIDENNMWAKMSIKVPGSDDDLIISESYIESFLKGHGISFGINRHSIELLAHQLKYGEEIEVAHGKAVANGVDGHVNFLVPVEDTKKPVINKDGTVDYLNSLRLAQIEEGQVFAMYIPPTEGTKGTDIFSNTIVPVPGKETKPMKGKGFTFNKETREYISSFNGHIIFDNGQITIEKLYTLNKDLDTDTGNVVFNGDVEIRGDVRSGMSIKADGSIFIHGHVGACNITAGENITINKGIQGRDRCIIKAGNDVTCKFVERCRIVAGGNVHADSILDSIVSAKNTVSVVSKTGTIIGGSIYGMLGIDAKEVGNESEVATRLQSGPLKIDMEKLRDLYIGLQKVNKDFETLETQLHKFEALDKEKQTKKTEELKVKILRAKVVVCANKKKLNEDYEALNKEINNAKENAYIRITGISHAGITIGIGDTYMTTTDAVKEVRYTSRQGNIIIEGA